MLAVAGCAIGGLDGAFDGPLGRVGFGGALADIDGRDGFGGALDNTDGRGFAGALDSTGDPQSAGFCSALDSSGFGGTLDTAGSPIRVAFRGLLDGPGDRDDVAWGGALASAGGRDDTGVMVGVVPTGTIEVTATFTGTLSDSGMSSQPESRSSSAEIAWFSTPCETPSAPFAILFKVPEPPVGWQLRTAPFYVATHSKFYEPRDLHRALTDGCVAIRDAVGRNEPSRPT